MRKMLKKTNFFKEFVEKNVYFPRKICYNIATITVCVAA